jgi:hypothetical protein
MARAPSTFKQGDVTRMVKGVVAAGVEVVRVEVDTDGRIVVIAGKPQIAGETPEDVKKLL